MEAQWTDWARARLLPFPDEAWTVDVDLRKAEAAVTKAGGAVPASPDEKQELARAIELRVNERYDEKGNIPRDTLGRDLVDVWVARAGVAFATKVLVELGKSKQRERSSRPGHRPAYELRRDGQPWGRLREHLAAASAEDRARAKEIATAARKEKTDVRRAVSYAFCDAKWVAEDLPAALEHGYGALAILATLSTAAQARDSLRHLLGETEAYSAKYQLVEEFFTHMPNLMRRLDDADAELVVKAARMAWNTATRKPWLEIVACLATPDARAFLAEHGGASPAQAKKPTAPAKKTKSAPAKKTKSAPAKKKPKKT